MQSAGSGTVRCRDGAVPGVGNPSPICRDVREHWGRRLIRPRLCCAARLLPVIACFAALAGKAAHSSPPVAGQFPAPTWPADLAWAASAPAIHVKTSEDLQRTLADGGIAPGTVIWVEPGRYRPVGTRIFQCRLNGTADRPIIVRGAFTPPAPQSSVIEGGIWADPSSYVWFWGLEITNSTSSRLVADRLCGLNLLFDNKRGKRAINCMIHDTGQPGIGFWNQGPDAEVYGCIVYHNGVYDDLHYRDVGGHPRGPGIYAHNDQGTVRVENNIFFGNFGEGIHAYGATGYVNGFQVTNNIAFMNWGDQIFLGSDKENMSGVLVQNNVAYRDPASGGKHCLRVGYTVPVTDATIRNNVVIGGTWVVQIERVHKLTLEDNQVYGMGDGALFIRSAQSAEYTVNHNTLWFPKSANAFAWAQGEGGATLYLQSDLTAFLHASPVALKRSPENGPAAPIYRVYRNRYEPSRYHVAVWNPAATDTVAIHLPMVTPGARVQVWDVQALSKGPADAQWRKVDGEWRIVLPMRSTAYDPLIGSAPHMHHLLHHTGADFGAFLIVVAP
ncbi:MAG: right-handed parallel beta-helix repeat-containing protein [Chthonomonadales bacterium]